MRSTVVAALALRFVVAALALRFVVAALALLAVVAPLAAQSAATSVTLYQDGRVLVRRSFPQRVPAGASLQHVALGPVDPSSLISLDSSVAITGATTTPALDADGALRAMVGKAILFRSGIMLRDTVRATLVSVDPLRVRLADGSIYFGLPGTATFPADQLPAESSTDVQVQARRASDQLRVGGFAQGGSWMAMYAVVVRGATAAVTGLANFATPLSASDAEVQLLAGQVNQAPVAARGFQEARIVSGAAAAEFGNARAGVVALEEGVGAFHLYTLPGHQTLRPGVMTSVALFDPAITPVVKSFEVGSPVPFNGYWGQSGDEGETPVSAIYTLTRARRTPFGDTPLPGGVARVFEGDSAGRLQLIGEAATGHTAPGEELRIDAGTAFDLVAKRVQTSWQQGQEPAAGGQRRTRTFVVSAYADTLRNQGATEATIDVPVLRSGDWQILESSQPAERLSSTRARFRVKVPAGGEAVLTYRIKATW